MRRRDLLLAVVAVVIAAAALLVLRWVRDEAPLAGRYKCPDCNVVLVSIDTLRADHLGCYGYHRPTSPNIDRFADDAVLFEQVVNTGGGTLPVHMSMFTSLPPIVHNVQPYNGRRLDAERITLAEQLKERGYTTAAFADGGWLRAQFGFDQGFDLYDDAGGGFRKIIPKVLAWIHTHREERFFLFVHTYDVHSGGRRLTYDPPEGFRGRFDPGYSGTFDGCRLRKCASELLVWLNNHILRGKISGRNFFSAEELTYIVSLYDGAIAYADSEIGRLLDALRALDLYDRTLIIVTSDHGEEFLEHGLMLHWQNYEEQARVPLILKLPSSRVRRRRVPALVSTLEVMPTILDIVDVPPNGEVRGESMMPLLRGGTLRRNSVLMSGREKLRTQRWSLVLDGGPRDQLYDLATDPQEQRNVAAEHPEVRAELRQRYNLTRRLQQQFAQKLSRKDEAAAPITEEHRRQLRSLGYLSD